MVVILFVVVVVPTLLLADGCSPLIVVSVVETPLSPLVVASVVTSVSVLPEVAAVSSVFVPFPVAVVPKRRVVASVVCHVVTALGVTGSDVRGGSKVATRTMATTAAAATSIAHDDRRRYGTSVSFSVSGCIQ